MTTRPPGQTIRAMIQALLNFCRSQKPTPAIIRVIDATESAFRLSQKIE